MRMLHIWCVLLLLHACNSDACGVADAAARLPADASAAAAAQPRTHEALRQLRRLHQPAQVGACVRGRAGAAGWAAGCCDSRRAQSRCCRRRRCSCRPAAAPLPASMGSQLPCGPRIARSGPPPHLSAGWRAPCCWPGAPARRGGPHVSAAMRGSSLSAGIAIDAPCRPRRTVRRTGAAAAAAAAGRGRARPHAATAPALSLYGSAGRVLLACGVGAMWRQGSEESERRPLPWCAESMAIVAVDHSKQRGKRAAAPGP